MTFSHIKPSERFALQMRIVFKEAGQILESILLVGRFDAKLKYFNFTGPLNAVSL